MASATGRQTPTERQVAQGAGAVMRQAVKLASAAVDTVRRPSGGVVVLIYHRVGAASGSQVDLPVELFRRQIAALAESGSVLTLDDAVAQLSAPGGPDDAPGVVVTFDDGTADFVDVALPILAEHGVPATLYVATAHVEDQRDFPGGGSPVSWAGLADSVASGLVTIGSHTHTHALLDRAPDAAVDDELDRSVGLIGERLGVDARHFAYPKAVAGSSYADRAVRERFTSAALAGGRANRAPVDLHRLARTPIQVSDGYRWFERKAAGGMALEEQLRTALNRRRYRHAMT